jgi:hypothetical protein
MRYTRLYFADENQDMFHEIRSDGYAERFIVVDRATGQASNAAARAEWRALDKSGRSRYEAKFGVLPTLRPEGRVPPPSYQEQISQREFENAWTTARAQLEHRWAASGHRVDNIEGEDG